MKIITKCILILSFLSFSSTAQAEADFFGKQNNGSAALQCEYLFVKAPPGWIISELKLTTKENIRNQIAGGGVFYSYVLLRDGFEEGSAADIVFIPQERQGQLPSQQKISVSVSKENCRMGNPANRVKSQIGASFMPFDVMTKIKNAHKNTNKRGEIIYTFEQ